MSTNRSWTWGLLIICLVSAYCIVQFFSSTYRMGRLVDQMEQVQVEDTEIKHIVLIAQELDNPFWRAVEAGAAEAAEQHGMRIDYMGPIRINAVEQLNLLEKSVVSEPDAILVQGISGPRYELLVSKAADQGIPVITVDADEPSSRRLAYVGTDNREAGKRMGGLVVNHAGGAGQVGVLIGSDEADNQKLRLEGFRSVMDQTPGFAIIAVRSSNISRIQAAKQTEAMIKENPSITMMVGFSSLDAVGIVEGLKAANRTDVTVYGFDNLGVTKQGIEDGTIKAAIVQQPNEIGVQSVYLLAEFFQGKSIPEEYHTDTLILDKNHLSTGTGSP